MNFSIVCMAFMLMAGYVHMESAECPETLKTELKAIWTTCKPEDAKRGRPEPGQSPPPTPTPEEKLAFMQCFVRELPGQENLNTFVSTCAAPAVSATEPELETYMTCVKTHLNSTGCFPKPHRHHN